MRRNPLLAAVFVAIALAILALTVVLPRGREVGRVEAQVERASARVADLRIQLGVLEATPPTDVAAEVAEVRRQVPSTAALPDLLHALTEAAETAGVTFRGVSVSPGTASATAAVSAIPISIAAVGAYFDLARFVFELEHLDRLLRVSAVSLAPGEAGGLTLSVTAEAYTTDVSLGPGTDPAPGAEVGA